MARCNNEGPPDLIIFSLFYHVLCDGRWWAVKFP